MLQLHSRFLDSGLSSSEGLNTELLNSKHLWYGKDWHEEPGETKSTGFCELDARLAGGGWPFPCVVELLYQQTGIGELRLLAPTLRLLSEQSRWMMWLNPPYEPNAQGLTDHGIDIHKTLIVKPEKKDTVWCIEQALKSGEVSVILVWLQQVDDAQLRRIQLACEKAKCLLFLFRPEKNQQTSFSPLKLRLRANACDNSTELLVDIVKRKRGWPEAGIRLFLNGPQPSGYKGGAKTIVKSLPHQLKNSGLSRKLNESRV